MKNINIFIKENLVDTLPEIKKIKVGDIVIWKNDYGVKWINKVIGFNNTDWYGKEYKKFVYLDTDSYWHPHSENELKIFDKIEINEGINTYHLKIINGKYCITDLGLVGMVWSVTRETFLRIINKEIKVTPLLNNEVY